MSRIFLSYSRTDVARVEELHRDLESLGHDAWLDQDLSGGQRWWERILESVRGCDIFLLAVSGPAIASRACLGEFEYAMALGKPVLPVLVVRNVSDSMMPPALAELQRVDYTQADKSAFAALNRGLATMPPAPPLPDPLPEPPAIPASYLFDLRTEIEDAGTLNPEQQAQLLEQLKSRLHDGHDPDDLRALVTRFRARPDVVVRIDRELGEFDRQLEEAARTRPQGRTFDARDTGPSPPREEPRSVPGPRSDAGAPTMTGATASKPRGTRMAAAGAARWLLRAGTSALFRGPGRRPVASRRMLLAGIGVLSAIVLVSVGVQSMNGDNAGNRANPSAPAPGGARTSAIASGGADEDHFTRLRRAALAEADGQTHEYPQLVIDDFVNVCVSDGGTQPACLCAIEDIQVGLTLEEYLDAYAAAFYGRPADPHVESVLFDALVQCGALS